MISSGVTHLTDEQFTELLVEGNLSNECQAHLAECVSCQEEQSRFLLSVGHFSQSSLAWSAAREPKSRGRSWLRQWQLPWFWAPAGLAFATVMAVVALVPAIHWHNQPAFMAASVGTSASVDSDAQIAEDNRLLQFVNVALAANEPSPLDEYGLMQRTASGLGARAKVRSEMRTR